MDLDKDKPFLIYKILQGPEAGERWPTSFRPYFLRKETKKGLLGTTTSWRFEYEGGDTYLSLDDAKIAKRAADKAWSAPDPYARTAADFDPPYLLIAVFRVDFLGAFPQHSEELLRIVDPEEAEALDAEEERETEAELARDPWWSRMKVREEVLRQMDLSDLERIYDEYFSDGTHRPTVKDPLKRRDQQLRELEREFNEKRSDIHALAFNLMVTCLIDYEIQRGDFESPG